MNENTFNVYPMTELLGKTLLSITKQDNNILLFTTSENNTYKMYHDRDCCEYVHIDDIEGDLNDLLNSPLLQAEVSCSGKKNAVDEEGYSCGSETWTFYKFATINGYITIKWYGSSNGYYSESVDFEQISGPNFKHWRDDD